MVGTYKLGVRSQCVPKKLVALICLLQIIFGKAQVVDYCTLNCGKDLNTVCLRMSEKCGANPVCGPAFQAYQFSNDERSNIVAVHNTYRNDVALGKTEYGLDTANDMHVFSYSLELEFIAQCWTNNCGAKHGHDSCRRTKEYSNSGQNLALDGIGDAADIIKKNKTAFLIGKWWNEIHHMPKEATRALPKDWGKTQKFAHLSQMLWAKTLVVGCAITIYGHPGGKKYLFICNYGPNGNILGASIYYSGPPTSRCESIFKEKANSIYTGLCGEIRPIGSEKWASPFSRSLKARSGFQLFRIPPKLSVALVVYLLVYIL